MISNNISLQDDVRIAFYVSGSATRLRRAIEILTLNHSYLLNMFAFVFIDNIQNLDLRNICDNSKIKLFEEDFAGIEKNQRSLHVSDKLLHLLCEHRVSYLICFGEKILKGEILTHYENRMINFHPSLLPAFKGVHAIDKALDGKAFLLGNSAHIIDEGVDTGPVIMQSLLPSLKYQTYDDVLNLQIPMLIQILRWLKDNRFYVDDVGRPYIKDASYEISRFIPNLEIDINY